jgi:hypothetical protein
MEQAPQVDLESIQDDLKEKGRELLDKAAAFAREQPHLAVAAAFGIGWILGNGLSPRIVSAGAKLGMRALLGGALAGTGLVGVLGGEEGLGGSSPRSSEGEGDVRGTRGDGPSRDREQGNDG